MTNEEAKAIIDKSLENGGWIPEADSFSFAELVRDALEKQIEAEKKPKRRIDTMTEEELAKIIAAVDGSVFGSMCEGCVLDDKDCECSDGNECGKAIAHYLLSPAEEEKK